MIYATKTKGVKCSGKENLSPYVKQTLTNKGRSPSSSRCEHVV